MTTLTLNGLRAPRARFGLGDGETTGVQFARRSKTLTTTPVCTRSFLTHALAGSIPSSDYSYDVDGGDGVLKVGTLKTGFAYTPAGLRAAAAAFEAEGAVMIRSAYSASELDLVAKGIARQMRCPSPLGEYIASSADEDDGPAFFSDLAGWRENDEVREFLRTAPASLAIAAALMRLDSPDEARFYHEHHLVKDAGASAVTPWHADQSYYPVDGTQLCSLWLPVDPVPLPATLRFKRGSHRDDVWYVPRTFAEHEPYRVVHDGEFGGSDSEDGGGSGGDKHGEILHGGR